MCIITFIVTFSCVFLSSSVFASDHYFTGLPLLASGWTDLEEVVGTPSQYSSSRIAYVSTSGNDSTGEYYSITDTEIGDNLFEPSGVISPYVTFAAAYAELRDGYADIILLKRGDSWTGASTISLSKSGASQTARFIIGAYGSSGDRPSYGTTSTGISLSGSGTASYLIVADIEFYPYNRAVVAGGPNGLDWDGTGHHVLFEGNYIHDFRNNIATTDSGDNSTTEYFALRRNVVVDSWRTDGHCQGIYAAKQGLTLYEENVWDHNGWHETHQDQNTHSRNMYLDYYDEADLMLRGNINARSSSEGVQMRYGGDAEYELSLQNSAIAAFGGTQTTHNFGGTYQKSVALDGRDIDDGPRGVGFAVGNRATNFLINENILAHQVSATAAVALQISNNVDMDYQPEETENVYVTNPIFTNNIVYDWYSSLNDTGWPGIMLYVGQAEIGLSFQDNIIQLTDDGLLGYSYEGTRNDGPDDDWDFSGNTYYVENETTPFDGTDISAMTYTQWITYVSETDSSYEQVSFTDPDRTIETYMTSLGENPTDYEDGLNIFLTAARAQSRFNWDDDYTAYAVINYIREGFDLDAISVPYQQHHSIGNGIQF